jgi:hypothetical protein
MDRFWETPPSKHRVVAMDARHAMVKAYADGR